MDLSCFLVEHGADTTAQDNCGLNPLHLAWLWNHVGLARFLTKHRDHVTAQATPYYELDSIPGSVADGCRYIMQSYLRSCRHQIAMDTGFLLKIVWTGDKDSQYDTVTLL
jgi:hypothetical protein